VRLWCNKFGPLFSTRLKHRHPAFGDTFFIDEVFVTIAGRGHYLWRAVDQDGDVIDVYLQTHRNAEAAKRFFRRLLQSHGTSPRGNRDRQAGQPRRLPPGTDARDDPQQRSLREQPAELAHQPTRARERGMRRFSSPQQAQRFPSAHAVANSLFNLQCHLASAAFYRSRRARAFKRWNEAVVA